MDDVHGGGVVLFVVEYAPGAASVDECHVEWLPGGCEVAFDDAGFGDVVGEVAFGSGYFFSVDAGAEHPSVTVDSDSEELLMWCAAEDHSAPGSAPRGGVDALVCPLLLCLLADGGVPHVLVCSCGVDGESEVARVPGDGGVDGDVDADDVVVLGEFGDGGVLGDGEVAGFCPDLSLSAEEVLCVWVRWAGC